MTLRSLSRCPLTEVDVVSRTGCIVTAITWELDRQQRIIREGFFLGRMTPMLPSML